MQVSQETVKVVLYSHLYGFMQFVVINKVEDFSHEADVFFGNSLALSMIEQILAI